jgi:hypothetical protein
MGGVARVLDNSDLSSAVNELTEEIDKSVCAAAF